MNPGRHSVIKKYTRKLIVALKTSD